MKVKLTTDAKTLSDAIEHKGQRMTIPDRHLKWLEMQRHDSASRPAPAGRADEYIIALTLNRVPL
jgi:hypothetical protein